MVKRPRCALLLLLSLSVAVNAFCLNNAASSEFRDPTPQERAMTSVAFAPGAPAVVLNWHQIVNDYAGYRSEYVRIKILSEEGKKYGDVEVQHIALLSNVDHIKARTVRPDGTIAPFDGRTFDKVIVKVGGVRLIAKTFTLPDVQVGSIVEYRYDISNRADMIYEETELMVQRELPVVHEEFSYKPRNIPGWRTFFSVRGLSPGKNPEIHGDTFEMQLENIPPFEEEPFAPPPATLKPRLQFWYSSGTTELSVFWTKQAHEWADVIEPFIGDSREVREATSATLVGATTPGEKLRKLYARVQQIRNLSFEPEKTDDETRKLRENRSAQDVLRNGYGDLRDINRLFVAMARAAGLDAHVIRVSGRDEQFLARNLPIGGQLDGEIAVVTAEGKPYYLDPGTPYAPFGTLSWQKTSTSGLLIARKQEQAVWVDTPVQAAGAAATRRVAALLLDNGVLRGTAVITYRGQEALRHRFTLRNDDDAAARKSLEKGMKAWFPDGAVVTLTDVNDLRTAEAPLVVSATFELPSAASLVGSRAMVPLAVFAATSKNPFPSELRKTDLYFHYAYGVEDDVTLKVPAGYDVESLPAPSVIDMGALRYTTTYEKSEGTIRLTRRIVVETQFLGRDKYPLVRSFFSKAAAADQEQVVLRKAAQTAGSVR
jgi:transglutaminase-like putative cysteine protease